ncbi:MAG: DUF6984 family protein [Pseudomonadota bacterium]
MAFRKPTLDELRLIGFLIAKAEKFSPAEEWQHELRVQDMKDGGMGSLVIFRDERIREDRQFGGKISECQFEDADGTPVIASLNIDQNGDLFELDVWKTSFDRLIRIPESL